MIEIHSKSTINSIIKQNKGENGLDMIVNIKLLKYGQ